MSNQDIFIEKSNKLYNEIYDYSLVKYLHSKIKVNIICQIHGIFSKTPNDHLNGYGCPKCGRLQRSKYIKEQKAKSILRKFLNVHGSTYDYSKFEYVTATKKSIIICHVHGEFRQRPNDHLNGHGCKKCFYERHAQNIKYNTEHFINLSNKIHNKKYGYTFTNYKTCNDPVEIFCFKHGKFLQTPTMHLQGHGCYFCGKEKMKGIVPDKKINGYLYLIEFSNNKEKFIKIGITKNNIKKRWGYNKNRYSINCINYVKGNLYDLYKIEQDILAKFDKKYIPRNSIYGGKTECFLYDELLISDLNSIFNYSK